MPHTNPNRIQTPAKAIMPGGLVATLAATLPLLIGLMAADTWVFNKAHANDNLNSVSAIIDDRPLSARILGGGDADIGDWPSIVPLIRSFSNDDLGDRLFCGGTVVANRWVLTAAHCLYSPSGRVMDANSISVVTGISDLGQAFAPPEYIVLRHYIHPDYDNSKPLPPHDIALLEFSENLNAPAAVLFAGETEDHTQSLGYIAGWGAMRYENNASSDFPNFLQDATVPLVSNAVCDARESYNGLIEPSHLCAGFVEGLVDACAGDSGGPLTISVNGQRLQAGITSFGNGCGLPNFYGIYTNVSHYLPWLSQYITVPEQSQALIDTREQASEEASRNNAETVESLGSINAGLLALLLLRWLPIRRLRTRARS